ncbi:hypothetical protein, partial [Nocardia brasiliensis]|uniref:hypothetical protein n=1 Tax=Nocardia brasiliensis TaxID=37326 RepID=UPI0024562E01
MAPLEAPAVNIRQSTWVFFRLFQASPHPFFAASIPNWVPVAATKPAPAPTRPAAGPVIAARIHGFISALSL